MSIKSSKNTTRKYVVRLIVSVLLLILFFVVGIWLPEYFSDALLFADDVAIGYHDAIDTWRDYLRYESSRETLDVNEISRMNLLDAQAVIEDYNNCCFGWEMNGLFFSVYRVGNEFQGVVTSPEHKDKFNETIKYPCYIAKYDTETVFLVEKDGVWYERRVPNEEIKLYELPDILNNISSLNFVSLPKIWESDIGEFAGMSFESTEFSCALGSCGEHLQRITFKDQQYSDFGSWGLAHIFPPIINEEQVCKVDSWEFLISSPATTEEYYWDLSSLSANEIIDKLFSMSSVKLEATGTLDELYAGLKQGWSSITLEQGESLAYAVSNISHVSEICLKDVVAAEDGSIKFPSSSGTRTRLNMTFNTLSKELAEEIYLLACEKFDSQLSGVENYENGEYKYLTGTDGAGGQVRYGVVFSTKTYFPPKSPFYDANQNDSIIVYTLEFSIPVFCP